MNPQTIHKNLSSLIVQELIKAGLARHGKEALRIDGDAKKVSASIQKTLETYIPLRISEGRVPVNMISAAAGVQIEKNVARDAVKAVLKEINDKSVFIYETSEKELPEGVAKVIYAIGPVVLLKEIDNACNKSPQPDKAEESL